MKSYIMEEHCVKVVQLWCEATHILPADGQQFMDLNFTDDEVFDLCVPYRWPQV